MPITVDPAFIKNTKQSGKSLQIVVAIEELGAISDSVDSKPDWDGSTTLINIDTEEESGSAIGLFHNSGASNISFVTTAVGPRYTYVAPSNINFLHHIDFTFFSTQYLGAPSEGSGQRTVIFTIRTGSHTGTILKQVSLSLYLDNIFIEPVGQFTRYRLQFSGLAKPVFLIPQTAGATYYVQIEIQTLFILGPAQELQGDVTDNRGFVPTDPLNCFLITSTLDLQAVPTGNVIFSVDDTRETGANIVYRIFGGNVNPPTTDLGLFVDGDTVTGFRYYRVTASFSSDAGNRGILHRISIASSKLNFIVNRPVKGLNNAHVLLLPAPIREISTKLDREKPVSVGEMGISMAWNDWLGAIIHEEFLPGKSVSIDIGYDNMSFSQFAPFFRGTWHDYTADHVQGIINVQLRDVLDQWRNVKLPKETADADGTKTTQPIPYSNQNIFSVMLDLFDRMGIPDRFIARSEFENLRDVIFPFAEFNVTRTLTKPIEAFKLLNELSVISGVFLVPYADGKVYPIIYDPNTPEAAIFNADFMDFGVIKGGYKNLFTRQLIYFNPSIAEPGNNEEDYTSLYIDLDATIETLWGESNEKRFYEKWNASLTLVASLADRWHSWFAHPGKAFTVSKASLGNIEVQPGDIVHVDRLHIPASEIDFPGQAQSIHCLILNRTLQATAGLSYTMVEVEEPVQCFPTSLRSSTVPTTGAIEDMQVADGNYFIINEESGGYDTQFDIICSADTLREFVFRGRYDGNPAHEIKVSVWNFAVPGFDNLQAGASDLPDANNDYFLRIPFAFGPQYFDDLGGGQFLLILKFLHGSPGSTSHDTYIDQLFLR